MMANSARESSVADVKLQLVGLAAVREALGDRWPGMAARAFVVAERTIQRHLRPGDIFRRCPDLSKGFVSGGLAYFVQAGRVTFTMVPEAGVL